MEQRVNSCLLSLQDKQSIEDCLLENWNAGFTYVGAGSNRLISLKPTLFTGYKQDDSDSSSSNQLFKLSQSAYFHMLHDKQNQSILLLGEVNTGKTFSCQKVLTHLFKVSKTKKSTRLRMIKNCEAILNEFGNCYESYNQNSSKFIQYRDLQFSNSGKLVGSKISPFLLDLGHLTNTTRTAGNFHVFHLLLSGVSVHHQRQKWHIEVNETFRYLNSNIPKDFKRYNGMFFKEFCKKLMQLGFDENVQNSIFDVLIAILYIGNLNFVDSDDSDSHSVISNLETLDIVAKLLGLKAKHLTEVLTKKSQSINDRHIIKRLNSKGASKQRDSFAKSIYLNLFNWIVYRINQSVSSSYPKFENVISLLDIPGMIYTNSLGERESQTSLNRFLMNFSQERLVSFTNSMATEMEDLLEREEIELDYESFPKNKDVMDFYVNQNNTGALALLDVQSKTETGDYSDLKFLKSVYQQNSNNPVFVHQDVYSGFAIKHYDGNLCSYDARGWTAQNITPVTQDFVSLVRGSPSSSGTENDFLRGVFADNIVYTNLSNNDSIEKNDSYELNRTVFLSRLRPAKRSDSTTQRSGSSIVTQFQNSFENVLSTFKDSQLWFLYHIKTTEGWASWDSLIVNRQIKRFGIERILNHPSNIYTTIIRHEDFIVQYSSIFEILQLDVTNPSQACNELIEKREWTYMQAYNGKNDILLNETVWRLLQDEIKNEDVQSISEFTEMESVFSTEVTFANSGENPVKEDVEASQEKETQASISRDRSIWLLITKVFTFWIPESLMVRLGKMGSPERRLAWKEKLTLCLLILILNLIILFFIIGLGPLLCDTRNQKSPGELSTQTSFSKGMVYMYGDYYKISSIASNHIKLNILPFKQTWENEVFGKDVGYMFPKDFFWNSYSPIYTQKPKGFQLFGGDDQKINQYWEQHTNGADLLPQLVKYKAGIVVWSPESLQDRLSLNENIRLLNVYERVYEVTGITAFNRSNYLDPKVNILLTSKKTRIGGDLTDDFEALKKSNPGIWRDTMKTLDSMFYVGMIDRRNELKCQISGYILFAGSTILLLIIFLKFVSALRFGSGKESESQEKFVICFIPCYTENEKSIRSTIDSLALTDYEDNRKLLFIVSDGLVIGEGNDRPTPRIVLDVLGCDADVNSPSFPYQSLGTGDNEVNFAKVYHGLYHIEDRRIPYVVVMKTGHAREKSTAGNRGKRDSQLILMQFLSKCHYNEPMNPLQLEIRAAMQVYIGLPPDLFEYLLMVDSDTTVERSALNSLITAMVLDQRIAGIAGDTRISNEKNTWVTIIQIYEYFVSQRMTKAFESLFGTVTCLPGCFSLYRIKSHINKPILVNKKIVDNYAINKVDTLHLKNLLLLGEDRYLTTLILKHFRKMKTSYTSNAVCHTSVPEAFEVLQSQRRRWINSTVHNLFELMSLKDLCGACCFSMRTVVFLDLLSTFTQPVILFYLIYIIYNAINDPQSVLPIVTILMLAFIYGLQLIFFFVQMEFDKLGWMIAYFVALPIYGFWLPFYSFWHFDDFSWGNTRVVMENDVITKKNVEEQHFGVEDIPLVLWKDAENQFEEPTTAVTSPQFAHLEIEMDKQSDNSSHGMAGDSAIVFQPLAAPRSPSFSEDTFQDILSKQYQIEPVVAGSAFGAYQLANSNTVNPISSYEDAKWNDGFHSEKDIESASSSIVRNSTINTSNESSLSSDRRTFKKLVKEFILEANMETTSKRDVRIHVENALGHPLTEKDRKTLSKVISKELLRWTASETSKSIVSSSVDSHADLYFNDTASISVVSEMVNDKQPSIKRIVKKFLKTTDMETTTRRQVRLHVESVMDRSLDEKERKELNKIIKRTIEKSMT